MTSLISLDLGGKNTGFFSFTAKDVSIIDTFQSGTIIYDESFVLSQVARRGKRHGKRNNLRNTLVKRLFLLLLQKHYGLSLDFLPDEILGLFNKRGYTYASFEIKEDEKENLESDILKEFLNDKLNYTIQNDDEVEEFLNQIASNEETFKNYKKDFENLFGASTHQPKKQIELIDEIKKDLEKEDAKELLDGLKVIKKIIDEFHKQQNQGNLPRAKYFEELYLEIEYNLKIQKFFTCNHLHINDMQYLIGNLSNYQLKELRRYFNDEAMAKEDFWSCEKLHRITWRFIQSWHPKSPEDKQRQKENLANLKTKSIIEFLTTTNPLMTIPPYDDMNNRGAVKCQTLRLNEEYLDKHLPHWRAIAHTLASETQKENLEGVTVKGYSEDSTLLHRILDTSSIIDPYRLRSDEIDSYCDVLTKDNAFALKKFAKEYYQLVKEKVRTGIWTKDDDMFKKCDHNPPHKNNQIHNLVAGILGKPIAKERFEAFENELWNVKFGNKKLSSYCKNIEEFRKSNGNLFKQIVELGEDKEVQKYQKELNEWVRKIGEFFNIETPYRARFNNLFSMAQLHTIIDTTRSGFNATCKWCSCENQYRASTRIEIDEQTGEITTNANCQRLPADTQRPFSGKIERYIDKLGYEIAKVKAKELEGIKEDTIDLKIILEQNAFAYEESIRNAKIKNANAKAKKALEEAQKRGLKNIEDKTKRIKDFSNSICPYCGQSLGEDGEIDHILSRSYTLKKYDTVFNSEGNLLYVHQKCNQAKLAKTDYSLQDLKIDISQKWIEEQIATIKTYKTFSVLTQEQQKAFKYALFLDNSNEAYQKVISWLRTDQSSRVNGTQKYLAKKIQEKLKAMFPAKTFNFEFILADANDVHDLRIKAYQLPEKPKDSKQETYSHTIDAVMSLVSVWDKVLPKTEKPTKEDILKFANVENWSALNNEFLTKGKSANQKIEEMIQANDFGQKNMRQVFSKPIFKDESIGERYKPFVRYHNQFYIGYPISIKDGYDMQHCQAMISKNDISRVEEILKDTSLCTLLKEKNGIKLYSINKQSINELSNQFFNLNYQNLNDAQKKKSELAEFVINHCKYYVKKTSVINAPQFIDKDSMKPYPFYKDWQKFHEAYKKELDAEPKTKKDNGKLVYDISGIDDFWTEFCKKYFGIKTKDNRNKARKVFSIVALTSAPGTVFRIKRKTPKGHIYQATAIDNQQISGDYANVLLAGNSKTLALAGQKPSSDLKKELSVKESKDIRDIKLEPSRFFKEGFDCRGIEVIVNKTSATIKNFPLTKIDKKIKKLIFKTLFEKKDGKRQKQKTSISLKEKNTMQETLKKLLKDSIKVTIRDGSISGIEISKKTVNFTLPFKSENLAKLLDD
ncbi:MULTISPECIES: type II-B CRISPR-associated RNA-guided endonuclease Cas9/Csx12 [unclassified Sulfurospirillum]|uniref:type II-B CRISPR-associated RNA-guided endonuclease Cas9/Csx12 n=1 Tax=unclassified Sulfurospirillum TaxID=2618290 RepID=UPI000507B7FE|nr:MULTISPECIES: type II-B CRISPR-associated RNA-guided endonuclease Cas9/Csx12 [unclassified Sulfurospirillum]KFL33715.1 hypothetical protein JU57_09230 [Sulfurospirillum sp. SCADC]